MDLKRGLSSLHPYLSPFAGAFECGVPALFSKLIIALHVLHSSCPVAMVNAGALYFPVPSLYTCIRVSEGIGRI